MNTSSRAPIRGEEAAPVAYCTGCDYGPNGYWPGSCCTPATHVMRLPDAHERPYVSYACPRHPSSGPWGSMTRYRSNEDAAAQLSGVLVHLKANTHPNDYPAAAARCREGAQSLLMGSQS